MYKKRVNFTIKPIEVNKLIKKFLINQTLKFCFAKLNNIKI